VAVFTELTSFRDFDLSQMWSLLNRFRSGEGVQHVRRLAKSVICNSVRNGKFRGSFNSSMTSLIEKLKQEY